MRAVARVLLCSMVLAGTGACGHVEPWVKPYEREKLADPIMAWDRAPLATGYSLHVHENREAARGGNGAAGGGCGCN